MSLTPPPLAPPETVLIIGAGEFGAALAHALITGPYKHHQHLITLLDRGVEPPAVDAASSDINKIVRQDYADPLYADLANKAIQRWRQPLFSPFFRESGIFISAQKDHHQSDYVNTCLKVNKQPAMQIGGKVAYPTTPAQLKQIYATISKHIPIDENHWSDRTIYYNQNGGWADARASVVHLINICKSQGVNVQCGEAASLIYNSNKSVRGAVLKDNRELNADFVVVAAGSWTSALVPDLATELLPTGQVVCHIQLDPAERAKYAKIPVNFSFDSGFYSFPPKEDGIMKFAIHGAGFVNQMGAMPSQPRTTLTPSFESQQIPDKAAKILRSHIANLYPELAKKKFKSTRLCWYSDRPSGDWLIDYHPHYDNLFIASGGSGHAFKFLPVMGELILSGINRTMAPEHKDIFSYKVLNDRRDCSRPDECRWGDLKDKDNYQTDVDAPVDIKAKL